MTIDAHQHYWSLARGDHGWLAGGPLALQRDFQPADLQAQYAAAGITGSVLVQSAPTLAETHHLLALAAQAPGIRAVVGWIDLGAADAVSQLHAFAADPHFRGIRPMLQDCEDIAWLLGDAVRPVIDKLVARDLSFDALIRADQLDTITALAQACPALRIVVDHGAKPPIASGAIDRWASALGRLAEQPRVACKLSGLISEAPPGAPLDAVAPYAEVIVQLFGANRVMWGSDWPMLVTQTSVAEWHDWCRAFVAPYGTAAIEDVFTRTSTRVYRIEAEAER